MQLLQHQQPACNPFGTQLLSAHDLLTASDAPAASQQDRQPASYHTTGPLRTRAMGIAPRHSDTGDSAMRGWPHLGDGAQAGCEFTMQDLNDDADAPPGAEPAGSAHAVRILIVCLHTSYVTPSVQGMAAVVFGNAGQVSGEFMTPKSFV